MQFLSSKFWLINLAFFQICWWLAALYQQQAVVFMLLLLLVHFVLSPSKKLDITLLPLVVAGSLLDQTLMYFGLLIFTDAAKIIPVWLVLLWVIFSLSLNHSLFWLNRISLIYVSILGATFGPISYWGGLSLGAFETSTSLAYFLLIYAVAWAIFLPLCCLYCKFCRYWVEDF